MGQNGHLAILIGVIVISVILAFFLVGGYGQKVNSNLGAQNIQDTFQNIPTPSDNNMKSIADLSPPNLALASGMDTQGGQKMGSDPYGNEIFNPVNFNQTPQVNPNACYPRDRLNVSDLLPKDAANSKWAELNPAGQGDMQDQNFLNAGYLVGINTVGSSLRNPNLQLRSEPPNPQVPVSPWMQSTIQPDLNQRPLEIGGDY